VCATLSIARTSSSYPCGKPAAVIDSVVFSLRALPLQGQAMCALVRHAHQFWPSAHGHRIGEAVEAPQGILVCGAIVFFWKVGFGLADTKARRSERVDKPTASDSVQGRNIHPSTRGHEILVSFATNGNFNKALAKLLKQLLVGCVVAIVTRRSASN